MILSIDIGLRNLSYNIMNAIDKSDFSTYKIHLWETYNTLDDDEYYCNGIQKSGKICGKKCGFKYKNGDVLIHCCKIHFPKTIILSKSNIFKKKLIKDYLLQDVVTIFLKKIQEIYDKNIELFKQITQIIVELQPKCNPMMQTISHVLYGKFVELYLNTNTKIKFVRANSKLKAYTGPNIECKLKGEYAKRKWLSIQYCKWFLETKFLVEEKEKWLPILLGTKKADDYSDVFLYSINLIHGMPKKQKTNKNGKCIK